MSGTYRAALWAETLKARRSRVPAATFGAVTLVGGLAALFMIIIEDPARARRLGLLGRKADLSGLTADWAGLLDFLAQVVSVADLLLFAFVLAWVFGREPADGTLRYLLALPVPRATIVLAKFTVAAAWSLATNVWLAAVVVGVGKLLALPGATTDVVLTGLGRAGLAAQLMALATTPVAFAASAGRGYLVPLASAVGALVVAQVAAALGWAQAVPWSVPSVAAGLAPGATLSATGIVVVAVTALAGVAGCVAWWRGSHPN